MFRPALPRPRPVVWGVAAMALATSAGCWWMTSLTEDGEAPASPADRRKITTTRNGNGGPRRHSDGKATPIVRETIISTDTVIPTQPGAGPPAMAVAAGKLQAPSFPDPAPAAPQFRAARALSLTEFGEPGRSMPLQPVALEFSVQAHLPAILAAPSPSAKPPSPAQSAAETRILEDFIAATQVPAPPETDGTGDTKIPAVEEQDARWNKAAQLADEEARLFLGHDRFIQKSLESALLRLQANRIPQ